MTREQIADGLHVDRAVVDAILDGEVHVELVVLWPSRTGSRVLRTSADLLAYQQCEHDVERFGLLAVQKAET